MLRALLFTVALASGGISAWLVAASTPGDTPAGNSAAPAPLNMVEVLVAATNLAQGQELLAEHLRWHSWPADSLNQAFLLRTQRPEAVAELAGSVLRSNILAGEPILADKFAAPGSSFLSAVLAPGKRAVAIAISAEKTAGGFVLPNDRVDVVQTRSCGPEDGCNAGLSVRTILRNVRVLAIDQSGDKDPAEGVLVGKTATLELDPLQTETIVGAEASGKLSLVLRSSADNADVEEAVPSGERTVRVWRNGDAEVVKVK